MRVNKLAKTLNLYIFWGDQSNTLRFSNTLNFWGDQSTISSCRKPWDSPGRATTELEYIKLYLIILFFAKKSR